MTDAHRHGPTSRRLTPADFDQTLRLGRDAFGDLPAGRTPPTRLDGTTAGRIGTGRDRPTVTPNGLALLWSGAQNVANLRFAALLTGPEDRDTVLDGLALHHPRHVRDYF